MKKCRLCAARLGAALLLLLGTGTARVSADAVTEKSFIVVGEGENGLLTEPVGDAAFWEYPMLSAGQSREDGLLCLVNNDKAAMDFTLKAVELPYDDTEALAYLNALRLRVTDGSNVLYDGPYARVMDEKGLKIEVKELARGTEKQLGVALYCDFGYEGDPETVSAAIQWQFRASPSAVTRDGTAPGASVWVLVLLCAAGALVILCIVLGGLNLTKRSFKKKK